MEKSETPNKVIQLGILLVKELSLENSNDTLGRWMAHYIAEKISAAENTEGATKAAAEKECMETILTIWKHRWELPPQSRPLRDFDQVLQTIQNLKEESHSPYYLDEDPEPEAVENNPWLEAVKAIDQATKVMLTYVLSRAAGQAATPNTAKWLDAAKSISADADIITIRLLYSEKNYSLAHDAPARAWNDEHRNELARLETQLESIEQLEQQTETVKGQIQAEIEALKMRSGKS